MPLDFIPICIMAIRNKDDCEFMQILFATHRDMMYRIALPYTGNMADADDMVSAACESLIRSIEMLRQVNPKVHPAYIMTAVRNQALMFLRRRKIEQRAYQHLFEQNDCAADIVPFDADDRLYYRCTLDEVIGVICRLSIDDQTILRLKFFDKLPDSEIAKLLGIRPSTVRTKIMRARRRLHAALKEKKDDT